MKNAATEIGLAILGIGIAVNGLNLNGNQANATTAAPVAFNAGPEAPTIVWYDIIKWGSNDQHLYRAWSDGTIEGRLIDGQDWYSGGGEQECTGGWVVISSPNEGLNAAADIGLLVAAWGDAPRNPMPPSDCPLGLIP